MAPPKNNLRLERGQLVRANQNPQANDKHFRSNSATGLNRRSFLRKSAAGAVGLAIVPSLAHAELTSDFKPDELSAMEDAASAFMAKHSVPGLSVAIARQERLVYVHAFGLADKDKNEKLTPDHLFRIASVSKPVTSAAIFKLIEAGKLKLSDHVFGPDTVLGNDFGAPPFLPHVDEITIEHLLTHTAGGWDNHSNDPMFSHPRMGHKELITWTLANQKLDHPPGEHYSYSNFGYCILGRVIEKLTGKPYAEAVQAEILKPCGITGMRISGNTLAERAPNEVVYFDQDGASPYHMNVRRMDSHGGWLATPKDLVRFLVRVDDFPGKADILKSETIQTMTTASSANAGYAKGWAVNSAHNWWHNGSLPGTSTIMVRTSGHFCWAALTNTRKNDSPLGGDLDRLMWDMIGKIKVWPSGDIFGY